tara:strand:+ start:206 stop:403 length:198 start_codon:yes stop_codon:yes gene_type:complete
MSDNAEKESSYPFCRCQHPDMDVCYYCEDTLDDIGDQDEDDEESNDEGSVDANCLNIDDLWRRKR